MVETLLKNAPTITWILVILVVIMYLVFLFLFEEED